jgi:hypothetical protein
MRAIERCPECHGGKVKTHNFTIIASAAEDFEDIAECFFEAGCDDATISLQKGVFVLEFDREARTFISAIISALRDVLKAGAKIERIEPDYLVSAAEIAKRSDQSRASISLYAKGERGSGFPNPIARITTDTPLWDWVEVSSWMHRGRHLSLSAAVQARALRELNKLFVEQAPVSSHLERKLKARGNKESVLS